MAIERPRAAAVRGARRRDRRRPCLRPQRREAVLARAVDAVARQDPAQLAAGDDAVEGGVDRVQQRAIVAPDADGVTPVGEIAAHAHARVPGRVTIDDDVVQQHGVGAPALEIDERFVGALVRDRHGADAQQQVPGLRAGQRADPPPAQRREVAQTLVAGARDQPLPEQEVRARKGDAARARRRHLQTVERDVEAPALQRRHQRRPIVLHEAGPHAQLARQRGRQLDLEPAQHLGLRRVLVDERLAALPVGAPPQLARAVQAAHARRRRGRAARREQGQGQGGDRADADADLDGPRGSPVRVRRRPRDRPLRAGRCRARSRCPRSGRRSKWRRRRTRRGIGWRTDPRRRDRRWC